MNYIIDSSNSYTIMTKQKGKRNFNFCDHGHRKYKCYECKSYKYMCVHRKYKYSCKICKNINKNNVNTNEEIISIILLDKIFCYENMFGLNNLSGPLIKTEDIDKDINNLIEYEKNKFNI